MIVKGGNLNGRHLNGRHLNGGNLNGGNLIENGGSTGGLFTGFGDLIENNGKTFMYLLKYCQFNHNKITY